MSEETKKKDPIVIEAPSGNIKSDFYAVPLEAIDFGNKADGRHKGVPKGVSGLTSNNVRSEEGNFDFTSSDDKALLISIKASGAIGGFKTPPILEQFKSEDGNDVSYIILQGNRRLRAIDYLRETEPEVFETIFPGGMVRCIVCSGLTEEQRWAIVADHAYMKRLKPVEQYYTVVKFLAFGWKAETITARITGSKSVTDNYTKVHEISQSATDLGMSIYDMCVAHIKGIEGAKPVPLLAIKAVASIVRKAKGSIEEELDAKCTLKGAYEGKTLAEIVQMVKSGETGGGAVERLRKLGEVKARFEAAIDETERSVLGWVLQIDGFDWEAEPEH